MEFVLFALIAFAALTAVGFIKRKVTNAMERKAIRMALAELSALGEARYEDLAESVALKDRMGDELYIRALVARGISLEDAKRECLAIDNFKLNCLLVINGRALGII